MSSRPRHAPILLSIVVALTLEIAPLPAWAVAFRPDWLALTMIYWAITYPERYSIGVAWIVGIVLDVAQGTLLGQHALALALVVYIAVKFHLQLRQFPMLQMTATVFALLALFEFILFWINGVAGVSADAALYWGPVLFGALIWPVVSVVLSGVRR